MFQPKVKLTEGQYESFKEARKDILLTYAALVAAPFLFWLAVSDIMRPFPVIAIPLFAVSIVGGMLAFLAEGGFRDRYREFRSGDFSYTA